jgi:2-polyprenyl-6-methoxyphenol hydroxylase-like FAD-dependent oxidoreductase
MNSIQNVFVVGGGPAGLAASIELQGRGFVVTVGDGAQPPVDKACGEGLMPDTVAALRKMGITLDADDGYPLRGIRFHYNGVSIDADFTGGQGIGVRRTVLHTKMAAHAKKVGVQLLWNAPVAGFSADGIRIRTDIFPADWIIGADGSGSRVRRWAGLESGTRKTRRFAFRSHFRVAPWSEYVEVFWASDAQAYVTPVGGDEVCVVVLSEKPGMRTSIIASKFPELAARLGNADALGTERGAVTTTRRLKHVYRNNVVLVGDASGAVDAITGEGLGLSFQHASVLADLLPSRNLSEYQKVHRRLQLRPSVMGHLLSLLGRQQFMRERTFRAFAAEPPLFGRFLDLHLGHVSLSQAARAVTSMGWRFATS